VGFVRPAVMGANQEWALDFVHGCGRERGEISRAACDRRVHAGMFGIGSGHELCEPAFSGVGVEQKIGLVHIEPRRPAQNAFVESFHGKLRDECLKCGLVWEFVGGAGEDWSLEGGVTTKSGRTSVWDIWRRGNLRDELRRSGRPPRRTPA